MRMKFAREGLPYICALGVATLVVDLLGSWWVGLFLLVLTLAVASFFRDPEREVPEGENHGGSPADGRVVAVDAQAPAETLPGGTFQRVAILLLPANVHVTHVPVAG